VRQCLRSRGSLTNAKDVQNDVARLLNDIDDELEVLSQVYRECHSSAAPIVVEPVTVSQTSGEVLLQANDMCTTSLFEHHAHLADDVRGLLLRVVGDKEWILHLKTKQMTT